MVCREYSMLMPNTFASSKIRERGHTIIFMLISEVVLSYKLACLRMVKNIRSR